MLSPEYLQTKQSGERVEQKQPAALATLHPELLTPSQQSFRKQYLHGDHPFWAPNFKSFWQQGCQCSDKLPGGGDNDSF